MKKYKKRPEVLEKSKKATHRFGYIASPWVIGKGWKPANGIKRIKILAR